MDFINHLSSVCSWQNNLKSFARFIVIKDSINNFVLCPNQCNFLSFLVNIREDPFLQESNDVCKYFDLPIVYH